MSSILAIKKSVLGLLLSLSARIIWFIPPPEGVTLQAWRIFDIFVTTIVGFMLQPMPIGAISIVSVGITCIAGPGQDERRPGGFRQQHGLARCRGLHISRGVLSRRGLDRRIALMIMKANRSQHPAVELRAGSQRSVLCPGHAVHHGPRGSIHLPDRQGALPGLRFEARRNGTQGRRLPDDGHDLHGNLHYLGDVSHRPWRPTRWRRSWRKKRSGSRSPGGIWALAGIVPGLASLLHSFAYVLYKIYPPELKKTPEAPLMAKRRMGKRGAPMDFNQKVMLCVFLGTIIMWSTGHLHRGSMDDHGVLGLGSPGYNCADWGDCLDETGPGMLIWLGVLVTLAGCSQIRVRGLAGQDVRHVLRLHCAVPCR